MKPEQVIIEARAKIIWGEPSSSVRDFLISNGISAIEADAKIKDFNVERNTEIRRLGIKNSVIGAAILGGGTITLYPCFKYFDSLTYIAPERKLPIFKKETLGNRNLRFFGAF